VQALKEDLENKYSLIRKYFGERDVRYLIAFRSNDEDLSATVPTIQTKVHAYDLEIKELIQTSTPHGDKLLITFIPLNKILEMYRDLGEKFFDQNIRSGLKRKPETNREIQRSLREILSGDEHAESFSFYHNGISLTALEVTEPEDLDRTKVGKIHLLEPRILNGAQTTICLADFVDKNKGDDRVDSLLKNVRVMARVVNSSEKEFRKKVTISTNRQNPIMPWNLMAHDEIQLKLYDKFREDLGIYYETREDAFSNLSQRELIAMGLKELGSPIEITSFGQTLQAIQGDVARISNVKETFANLNYYKEAFKQHYLGVESRRLVLLYKVQFGLNGARNEIRKKGEEKYHYVGKAKNLIWALLIQGLQNNEDFEEFVDKYGNSPDLESDFRVLLKDIASPEVRLIMGDTFEKPPYAGYLDLGETSFLRNNSTFKDCMSSAKKRYGWEFKIL
jgi:hypothetical protein